MVCFDPSGNLPPIGDTNRFRCKYIYKICGDYQKNADIICCILLHFAYFWEIVKLLCRHILISRL